MGSPIQAIQSCRYLFLHSISESEEEPLRIVLHEVRVGESPSEEVLAEEALPEVREILSKSRSIVHGPGCQVFELVWSRYIGYSVENESYATAEPIESVGEGQLLKVYTKSVYLEYLAKATFATAEYPGPFKHWAIFCLDHIVNVAATEEPIIRAINGG